MDLVWGIVFGGLAAAVLLWLLVRVIAAERIGNAPLFMRSKADLTHSEAEFASSEPELRHVDAEDPLER